MQLNTSPSIAKDSVRQVGTYFILSIYRHFFSKLSHVFTCSTCHSLEFQPLIKKTVHNESVRFNTGHFASSLFNTITPEIVNETNEKAGESRPFSSVAQCVHCNGKSIHVGGPIYTAPMHDQEFVERLLNRYFFDIILYNFS